MFKFSTPNINKFCFLSPAKAISPLNYISRKNPDCDGPYGLNYSQIILEKLY